MARALTPEAVFAVVDQVMSRPFAWGPCDCTSAACDVFRWLHGVDLLARWRGRYASKSEALRLIAEMGGPLACAEEMARGLTIGEQIGGVGYARRSLLICIRPGMWAGKTHDGFALMKEAERAWYLA